MQEKNIHVAKKPDWPDGPGETKILIAEIVEAGYFPIPSFPSTVNHKEK